MAFFRRAMSTGGYAGGTLEEQLARALQGGGDVNAGQGQALGQQVLTPANTAAITRPRTVAPTDSAIATATPRMRDMLTKQAAEPLTINTPRPTDENLLNAPAMRETQPNIQLAPTMGSSDEPFGTRPRRTQMRDYVADDAAYLRDLEAQPRNWKDKTVDAIRALNTNFNGPSVSPPTKRERELAKAQGGLARSMAVEKSQQQSALSDLVPVRLEDGSVVMAPARTAGSLSSQQQGIKDRRARTTGYIEHLKTLKGDAQKKLTAQLFKTGALNTPEGMKYAADVFGIPEGLQEAFIRGEHRDAVDDEGNFIDINRRTNKVTSTGEKAYETTKEAGRDERARLGRQNSRGNALIMAGQRAGEKGDPEEFERLAKDADADAKYADDEAANLQSSAYASDKQTARQYRQEAEQHKRQARELRIKATQARGAQGAVTQTPTTAPSGRGSFNLKGWLTAHPDATDAEIKAMRAKAKARRLTVVE